MKTTIKRIHGMSDKIKLTSRYGFLTLIDKPYDWRETCPLNSGFNIGDKVLFTNDAGAMAELKIWGFGNPDNHGGRFVYAFTDAHWFPIHPDSLKLI